MAIHVLDNETINQIAAGEVIERPSSVIKELVENSIDAGATAVSVEIKDGGIASIRVTDNGCGIKPEEVPTAFLRHATSKLTCAEDLMEVASLGFRGEALASIAAIARCELITRTNAGPVGIRYIIEGGNEISSQDVGAPEGTTFIIRDLFYNTPARRKFLKSASTESGYAEEVLQKIALAHPEISIHFVSGGKTLLHTTGQGRLKDVIYTIFGREVATSMLEVDRSTDELSISGFIGKPLLSRGNRGYELYDINGRFVKNETITAAIEDAYKGFVMQHKYPFAVLHISVPSYLIDVNVHPAKLEVRFARQQEMYDFVYQTVLDTLSGKELITEVKAIEESAPEELEKPAPQPFETERKKQEEPEIIIQPEKKYQPIEELDEYSDEMREIPAAAPELFDDIPKEKFEQISFEEKILSSQNRPQYRIIGTLFDTYILIEYGEDFLLIDQHAAHEKVLYERTIKELDRHEHTSQLVSPAIVLTVSSKELSLIEQYKEKFEAFGYDIEQFGGHEIAVHAVPANLYSIANEKLLISMLDDLTSEYEKRGNKTIEEKIAMMSCKAAVKGNMHLSMAETEALLDELLSLDHPYTCPHGRPTAIIMTKTEIEKMFKRIV